MDALLFAKSFVSCRAGTHRSRKIMINLLKHRGIFYREDIVTWKGGISVGATVQSIIVYHNTIPHCSLVTLLYPVSLWDRSGFFSLVVTSVFENAPVYGTTKNVELGITGR